MPGGFNTLLQVDSEFYGLFNALDATPKITLSDGKTAEVRFYKRGEGSDAQDRPITYPVVSIQNFPAEVDRGRLVHTPTTYEGDFERNDEGELEGRQVPYALPLTFRYLVSAASLKQTQYSRLQQWFLQEFDQLSTEPCLLLDRTETPFGPLGEVVLYKMMVKEVPREDKVFELQYDFTLQVWVNVRASSALLPMLGSIDLSLQLLDRFTDPDYAPTAGGVIQENTLGAPLNSYTPEQLLARYYDLVGLQAALGTQPATVINPNTLPPTTTKVPGGTTFTVPEVEDLRTYIDGDYIE